MLDQTKAKRASRRRFLIETRSARNPAASPGNALRFVMMNAPSTEATPTATSTILYDRVRNREAGVLIWAEGGDGSTWSSSGNVWGSFGIACIDRLSPRDTRETCSLTQRIFMVTLWFSRPWGKEGVWLLEPPVEPFGHDVAALIQH